MLTVEIFGVELLLRLAGEEELTVERFLYKDELLVIFYSFLVSLECLTDVRLATVVTFGFVIFNYVTFVWVTFYLGVCDSSDYDEDEDDSETDEVLGVE